MRVPHADLLGKLQAALLEGVICGSTPTVDQDAALKVLGDAASTNDAVDAPPLRLSEAVYPLPPVRDSALSLLCGAFDIKFAHAVIVDAATEPTLSAAVRGMTFQAAQVRATSDPARDPALHAWVKAVEGIQATRAGVAMLKRGEEWGGMRESELAIFYRRDHFWVLFKHSVRDATGQSAPRLYLLVTAEGLAGDGITWQELTDDLVEGAFFRDDFSPLAASDENAEEEENRLMSLAIEESLRSGGSGGGGGGAGAAPTFAALPRNDWQAANTARVAELSRARIAREQARAAAAPPRPRPPPQQRPSPASRDEGGCTVC